MPSKSRCNEHNELLLYREIHRGNNVYRTYAIIGYTFDTLQPLNTSLSQKSAMP